MSNAVSSSLNPPFSYKSGDQNKSVDSSSALSTPHNFSLPSWSSSAGPSTWQTNTHPNPTHFKATGQASKKTSKIKKRTIEEEEIITQTSNRLLTIFFRWPACFSSSGLLDLQRDSLWITPPSCTLMLTALSPTPSTWSTGYYLITYTSSLKRTWNS